jgi:Putative Flp pilus-assembly TadE/G-like
MAIFALIGFTGLAVETGFWYTIKRQNQSAADVAALSGARELYAWQAKGTAAYPDICALAERDAQRNNFTFNSFTCPSTSPGCTSPSSGQMCANNPPATPGTPNYGNTEAVEVILAQQQNTFFAGLFLPNVTIDTRAVAAILTADEACVLALNTSGTDVTEQGNPSICLGTASGGACGPPGTCSVAAASSSPSAVSLGGSSSLIARAVVTPGGCSGCGSVPVINAPISDPYVTTLTHSFLTTGMPTSPNCTLSGSTYSGSCVIPGPLSINSNTNLSANTQIVGGLDIKNSAVNLAPGTYWITDGDLTLEPGNGATLECTTCTPGGAGVTIILTTAKASGGQVGTLTLGANANLDLNAPSSGTFAGLAIIQDSNGLPSGTTYTTSPDMVSGQGNPTETLNGLVYFPNATMDFYGTPSGGNTCLVLVANTVDFHGNSTLTSTGCASSGLTNLPTPVVLTE